MPTTTGIATEFIRFSRPGATGGGATVTDSDGKIKWAPHNLLTNSESFDAAAWVKIALTVDANAAVAPNGTTTADTITLGAGTAGKIIYQASAADTNQRTVGFYVKIASGTVRYLQILQDNNVNAFANFDIVGIVVGTKGTSAVSSAITSVGSGWYYISASFTGAGNGVWLQAVDSQSATYNQTAAATGTYHLWGAALYRSDLGGMQPNTSAYPLYNPTTPKNLLGFSEDFSNAAWAVVTGTATKSSNTDIAPNGLQTADTLTATSADTIVWQTYVPVADCKYTGSIYLKRKSGSGTIQITVDGSTFTTVALTTSWQRFSATYTAAAGSKAVGVKIVTSGDEVYAWGAQLSDSASLDTYAPVYGAAVTSAAYYGPRRDFNASTLACNGLLVEELRSNLVLNSAAFDNGTWFTSGATVAADVAGSTAVAPDGTNTADKLAEDNSTGTHRVLPVTALVVVSGSPYTYSVYAKAVERTKVVIVDNDIQGATFDLSNGTVSALGTGVTAPPPVLVGNGWYRCAITRNAGSVNGRIGIYLADGTGATSYTGVTGNGILIYGAQVEAGSFATSYIPTGSASTTRNPDLASVSAQAFPYNATEGTLVVNGSVLSTTAGNRGAFTLASVSGYISIGNNVSGLGATNADFYTLPAGTFLIASGAVTAATPFKEAAVYKANDFALSVNGAAAVTSSSGSLPTAVTDAYIGRTGSSSAYFNGHIRQITYLPRRISNAELITRSS